MDQIQKRIHDIIAGNIGNRMTQELANGMFSSLLVEVEAAKTQAAAAAAAPDQQATLQ